MKKSRTLKYLLLVVFNLMILNIYCQSNKKHVDSLYKNSSVITFKILDYDLGATCGDSKSSGVLLCEIKKSSNKSIRKKILLIVQCARNAYSENYFTKDTLYKCNITKEEPLHYVYAEIGRFNKYHLKEYYALKKVEKLIQSSH